MRQHTNPAKNAKRVERRAAQKAKHAAAHKLSASPARKRKQHAHPLSDAHGAYTLVGNNPFMARRMWLAGVSAQRGF